MPIIFADAAMMFRHSLFIINLVFGEFGHEARPITDLGNKKAAHFEAAGLYDLGFLADGSGDLDRC
jgi:hypothetical protein